MLLKKIVRKNSIFVLIIPALLTLFLVLKAPTPMLQFGEVCLLVSFYLFWALIYHYVDKTLTFEVVIEYVLTAILAMIVLYGVLV